MYFYPSCTRCKQLFYFSIFILNTFVTTLADTFGGLQTALSQKHRLHKADEHQMTVRRMRTSGNRLVEMNDGLCYRSSHSGRIVVVVTVVGSGNGKISGNCGSNRCNNCKTDGGDEWYMEVNIIRMLKPLCLEPSKPLMPQWHCLPLSNQLSSCERR